MANQTILLVDADQQHLRVMEVSLRKAGYDVITSQTTRDAQAQCARQRPDLIISETQVGNESGFDLCEQIKRSHAERPIPFVFLTIDTRVDSKVRGMQLDVDDYVIRPIYTQELIGRVQMILDRHTRNAEGERRKRFFGDLGSMGVVDLLRRMQQGRKSAALHLKGEHHRGTIWFRDGVVVDANTGRLTGEDAVYRLLRWDTGSFEIDFRLPQRPVAVTTDTSQLLMEGLRRIDEWARIAEQLPPLNTIFSVDYSALADNLAELPDMVNSLLRLFDGRRTANEVIAESDRPDLETLDTLSQLYFEGIIAVARPAEDESNSQTVPDYKTSVPPAAVPTLAETLIETASALNRLPETEPKGKPEPETQSEQPVTAASRPIEPPPTEAFTQTAPDVATTSPDMPVSQDSEASSEQSIWDLKASVTTQDAKSIITKPPEKMVIMTEEEERFPEFEEPKETEGGESVDDDFFGAASYTAPSESGFYEDSPYDESDAAPSQGPKIAMGLILVIILGGLGFYFLGDKIEPIAASEAALHSDWHSTELKSRPPVGQTKILEESWHIPSEPGGGSRPDEAPPTTPPVSPGQDPNVKAPKDAEKLDDKTNQPVANAAPRQEAKVDDKKAEAVPVDEKSSKTVRSLVAKGIKSYGKGQFELASSTFEKALAIDPASKSALLAYAKTLLELNRMRDAMVAAEKISQMDPSNAEAQLLLGNARQELGQNKASIVAYEQYLKLAPNGKYSSDVRQVVKGIRAEIGGR